MRTRILIVALAVGAAGCGSANVVTPTEVVQNYVYSVAEGNLPAACALLDQRTRETLVSAVRPRVSCPRLFARCLPSGSPALRHDQAQLLYANVDLEVHGNRADVQLSGTAVARAAKEVSLVDRRAHWRLTSPGRAITRCVHRLRRRGHRGRGPHG